MGGGVVGASPRRFASPSLEINRKGSSLTDAVYQACVLAVCRSCARHGPSHSSLRRQGGEAVRLPIEVALAQACPVVPDSHGSVWAFEPKFDGWRCCAGPGRLYSRAQKSLTARFPEIVEAVAKLGDVVIDGELVAWNDGHLDFAALQAGPKQRRSNDVTVYLMAFDLLGQGERDLRAMPYRQRRAALVELLHGQPALVQPVPMTAVREQALEWMRPECAEVGIEGVIAKRSTSTYLGGRRSGWRKTRSMTTTEAAVLGVTRTCVVLGRPTPSGQWRAVGLSRPLDADLARDLACTLHRGGEPARLPGVVAGLPGSHDVDFQPTVIDTVVEVETDRAVEFGRWRHRPRVLRRRADLTPEDLPCHLSS